MGLSSILLLNGVFVQKPESEYKQALKKLRKHTHYLTKQTKKIFTQPFISIN